MYIFGFYSIDSKIHCVDKKIFIKPNWLNDSLNTEMVKKVKKVKKKRHTSSVSKTFLKTRNYKKNAFQNVKNEKIVEFPIFSKI